MNPPEMHPEKDPSYYDTDILKIVVTSDDRIVVHGQHNFWDYDMEEHSFILFEKEFTSDLEEN